MSCTPRDIFMTFTPAMLLKILMQLSVHFYYIHMKYDGFFSNHIVVLAKMRIFRSYFTTMEAV